MIIFSGRKLSQNGRDMINVKTLYSIALVTLLLISTGGEAVSKTAVIKIATLAPEGSTWTEIFNDLNAELKTA
jgi:hypothetical protein